MTVPAVDCLLAAVEAGVAPPADVFVDGVVLDATVPNWRFTVQGRYGVSRQFGEWFHDRGTFEELVRRPLPNGELVEFTLAWEESGVPYACHQVHVLAVEDGRIEADTVFCGGRWPASLLAEMAEASGALA
ncbi:MAG: hypothetical protein AB1679_05170 [Actinomycetota bacterium]|jgi:hypothetical protein